MGENSKFEDAFLEVAKIDRRFMGACNVDAGIWSLERVAGFFHDVPAVRELTVDASNPLHQPPVPECSPRALTHITTRLSSRSRSRSRARAETNAPRPGFFVFMYVASLPCSGSVDSKANRAPSPAGFFD